jgi:hypothetical protein
MSEPITICFVGTAEQKTLLEQWAKQDDRSVSYIMRQILSREAQRRKQSQPTESKTTQRPH